VLVCQSFTVETLIYSTKHVHCIDAADPLMRSKTISECSRLEWPRRQRKPGEMLMLKQRSGFLLASFAAVVVQSVVFVKIYNKGIASKLIPWDECTYVFEGLVNADLIRSQGLIAALPHLTYAHVPITAFQITGSLLLSGFRVSTPYIVNTLYLYILLYSIVRALRSSGLWAGIALSMVAISTPMVFSSHPT
jgi:hypothetical protein